MTEQGASDLRWPNEGALGTGSLHECWGTKRAADAAAAARRNPAVAERLAGKWLWGA